MTIKNALLGGIDWIDGDILYAADLNGTENVIIEKLQRQNVNSQLLKQIGHANQMSTISQKQAASNGWNITTTGGTSFNDTAKTFYYCKAGGVAISLEETTPISTQSNITAANVFFDYELMAAQDTFANTSNWSKVSGVNGSFTVSGNVLTVTKAPGTGIEAYVVKYTGFNLGSLTIGARYTFLYNFIKTNGAGSITPSFTLGTPGGAAVYTMQSSTNAIDVNGRIDMIASAINKLKIWKNQGYIGEYTFSSGDTICCNMASEVAGSQGSTVTIYLFGVNSAPQTDLTKKIRFDGTNWEYPLSSGYLTPANNGKAVDVVISGTTNAADVGLFYGYSVQVE